MNRTARIGILLASAQSFCYAGIGHVLGRTPDDKAYKSLTVYGEVLQKIQSDYVDEPNMRLVTAGSLHGMLESLMRSPATSHRANIPNTSRRRRAPAPAKRPEPEQAIWLRNRYFCSPGQSRGEGWHTQRRYL